MLAPADFEEDETVAYSFPNWETLAPYLHLGLIFCLFLIIPLVACPESCISLFVKGLIGTLINTALFLVFLVLFVFFILGVLVMRNFPL